MGAIAGPPDHQCFLFTLVASPACCPYLSWVSGWWPGDLGLSLACTPKITVTFLLRVYSVPTHPTEVSSDCPYLELSLARVLGLCARLELLSGQLKMLLPVLASWAVHRAALKLGLSLGGMPSCILRAASIFSWR